MRFFSLFLSVIVLSSCTYGVVKSSLDEAQQWVDEKPDTSLSILKTLNRQSLRGRSAARYSLIYAKALDKNYIDTTDISIIEPALKFYDRFGTDFEKAQTHYYEGRILQNAGLSGATVYTTTIASAMTPTSTTPTRTLPQTTSN